MSLLSLKILTADSPTADGTVYTREAVKSAMKLYDGMKVQDQHGNVIGTLGNLRETKDGFMGDVELQPIHGFSSQSDRVSVWCGAVNGERGHSRIATNEPKNVTCPKCLDAMRWHTFVNGAAFVNVHGWQPGKTHVWCKACHQGMEATEIIKNITCPLCLDARRAWLIANRESYRVGEGFTEKVKPLDRVSLEADEPLLLPREGD